MGINYTKLYLIRHGEVEYPLDVRGRKLIYDSTVSLAPLGRLQMEKLGEKLVPEQLDVITASPYERTQESAELLQRELQIPLFTVEELEDMDSNSWIGYPLEDLSQNEGDIYSNPKSETQETLEHLVTRARNVIEAVVSGNPGKRIGIVSHGDLLCAMDWVLKHEGMPASYGEMKNSFYLNKGQACEYTVDDGLHLVGEGRLITVSEVSQSLESFRYGPPEK